MNVLHINTHDIQGGAGRALNRLHTSLQRQGVDSHLLVRTRKTDQDTVAAIRGQGIEFAFRGLSRRTGFQDLYFPSTSRLSKHPWVQRADVLNLHNIHGHYFAFTALAHLSHQRPIVWTLHDMWSFTGHCSYSFDCLRWQTGCGKCPYRKTYPAIPIDTSALLWRAKQSVYRRARLTLVTPSRWLADLTRQSPLLNPFPVHCIPNSVDTDIFRPQDQQTVRSRLNLPIDAFLILFMAESLDDSRKGGDLLLAALQKLARDVPPSHAPHLITFGRGGDAWRSQSPFPVHALGMQNNEKEIAAIYTAANVFVLPTRQDNLPNGLLESLACGTPCISFNTGGIPDAIHHLETGYIARPGSVEDLSAGIQQFMNNPALAQQIRKQCRQFAEQNYTLAIQAQRYIDLYTSLISTEPTSAA